MPKLKTSRCHCNGMASDGGNSIQYQNDQQETGKNRTFIHIYKFFSVTTTSLRIHENDMGICDPRFANLRTTVRNISDRRHVLRLGWRPCTSLLGPISLIRVGALGPGPRLPVILRLTAAEHGQTVTGRWHQEFKRVLRTRR